MPPQNPDQGNLAAWWEQNFIGGTELLTPVWISQNFTPLTDPDGDPLHKHEPESGTWIRISLFFISDDRGRCFFSYFLNLLVSIMVVRYSRETLIYFTEMAALAREEDGGSKLTDSRKLLLMAIL